MKNAVSEHLADTMNINILQLGRYSTSITKSPHYVERKCNPAEKCLLQNSSCDYLVCKCGLIGNSHYL